MYVYILYVHLYIHSGIVVIYSNKVSSKVKEVRPVVSVHCLFKYFPDYDFFLMLLLADCPSCS